MQALRVEGPATHNDPESCAGIREEVGEALTGARAGQAIEPRNYEAGVPTVSPKPEGHIAGGAMREPFVNPARSKNLCMLGVSMRENREIPVSPFRLITGWAAQGRPRSHA